MMNNVFRILAKPAKLAKAVCDHLCELRGLGVKNTTKQFVNVMCNFFLRLPAIVEIGFSASNFYSWI